MSIILPRWYDLHAHFRQGPNVKDYVRDHLAMGCAGALAMPNTKPPVAAVIGENSDEAWTIEGYRREIEEAGGSQFQALIVPLYLTSTTTPEMIAEGAKSGLLQACKYYPPHGTTNAEHGVPMQEWIGSDVFRAMAENDIVLCIHGEQHGIAGPEYFDANRNAEKAFYEDFMPRLLEEHPDLKIVCEHITTRTAADFVQSATDRVGATVTPQHLLYTVSHLLQGLRYHLYCLPLVKFEDDLQALREAVTQSGQTRFFAGTDSAPHTTKATDCGCAAGCYTGGCAPQLYAMAFEAAGADLESQAGQAAFESFLCENGRRFYDLPTPDSTFMLIREKNILVPSATTEGQVIPLPAGMKLELEWKIG